MDVSRYGNPDAGTVLIQMVDDHDLGGIESEAAEIRRLVNEDFCLIAVKAGDWNTDLSPWKAPAVFGKEDFGGGAERTLAEVLKYTGDPAKTYYIGGYSLAGLFAVWAAYQTDVFSGAAAASPSVWFPGFVDSFMRSNECRAKAVYLSLGDREEKARNPVMAAVGNQIREAYELLKAQGIETALEWNPGNHFADADIRTAKAFAWVMKSKTAEDNRTLVRFWSRALALSDEDRKKERQNDADSWKESAPSDKLFRATASLGGCRKVLDYGCGSAWAGIIAAKHGCPDVTAADAASGAAEAAGFYAALYGVDKQVHAVCTAPDWLQSVPDCTYDGLICSNVLDVVPSETAEGILREAARIVTPDAAVIIGLNYYLSGEAAAAREMKLTGDRMLYIDGVLRLVSRTDEEWAGMFEPYFTVEKLDHFAWPGEKTESRRLFYLRRKK